MLGLTYAQQQIIGFGGYIPEDVWDVQRIMTSEKVESGGYEYGTKEITLQSDYMQGGRHN